MFIRENTLLPPFIPLPKFILETRLGRAAKLFCGLLLNRTCSRERTAGRTNRAGLIYVLLPDDGRISGCQEAGIRPMDGPESGPCRGQNLPPNKTEREEKDLSKTERAEPAPLGHYQNVFLSQRELEELRRDFPGLLEGYIEKLSAYMKEKGKTYACHEAVLRRWLNEDSGRTKNWDDIYEEGECL